MDRIRDEVAGPMPRRRSRASMLGFGNASSGFSNGSAVGRAAKPAEVAAVICLVWLDLTMPMSVGRGRPCFLFNVRGTLKIK